MRKILSGFTLVELLVSVSLMAVLVSASVARYINYRRQQTAKATADQVRQLMQEVKSNVISGKKDCAAAFCGGANGVCDGRTDDRELDSWQIVITATNYTIRGVCEGTPFMIKTDTFGNTISVMDTNPTSFFRNGTASRAFTVRSEGGNWRYTVTLDVAGNINQTDVKI
jgi:prepilin-type N-terminal cleavage/methylation domain-containing protein